MAIRAQLYMPGTAIGEGEAEGEPPPLTAGPAAAAAASAAAASAGPAAAAAAAAAVAAAAVAASSFAAADRCALVRDVPDGLLTWLAGDAPDGLVGAGSLGTVIMRRSDLWVGTPSMSYAPNRHRYD